MHTGFSAHSVSARATHAFLPTAGGRRHVNIRAILETLRNQYGIDDSNKDCQQGLVNGKKRPRDSRSSPSPAERDQKRVKLNADGESSTERVVYAHTFVFGLTSDIESNQTASQMATLVREEEELAELATKLGTTEASDGLTSVDVGEVSVIANEASLCLLFNDNATMFSNTTLKKQDRQRWLTQNRVLVIPQILDGLDLEEHGFAPHLDNVMYACAVLQNSGLLDMTGTLRLTLLKDVQLEDNELPIQLHLTLRVALLLPLPNPISLKTEVSESLRRFLSYVIPGEPVDPSLNYSQTDIGFYYSVLKPAPHIPVAISDAMQPDNLLPTLLPFQRRSLSVMLAQEGKIVEASGAIIYADPTPEMPMFWRKLSAPWDHEGDDYIYYNRFTGELLDQPPERVHYPGLFVAEEMGLGKTLECIALLLLNRLDERTPTNTRWDEEAEVDVAEVRTSLIVTPPSLAQQWVDECEAHAPSLRVMVYQGWTKFAQDMASFGKKLEGADDKGKRRNTKRGAAKTQDMDLDDERSERQRAASIAAFFHEHVDVVITTYNVLQQEIGVARAPVKRPRREKSNYSTVDRMRSPLICVEWGRLIMDEAQLVGTGKAAEMLSLIPREASFAVSGTPAKASVGDLYNALKFIRVPHIIPTTRHWNRLLLPAFAQEFAQLFSSMTVRTLKSQVKNELTIPSQARYLVPISLGRVERQVYGESLDESLLQLGVNIDQANVDMEVDTAVLRNALKQLRGLCTHPQVGRLQRQDKPGTAVLRSISEVLEKMTDQTWKDLMEDRRNRIVAHTKHAQLIRKIEDEEGRDARSLAILISAREECEKYVDDIKVTLEEHLNKGNRNGGDEEVQRSDKGKGKQQDLIDNPSDTDSKQNGVVLEEYRAKTRGLRARLREAYHALHKIVFLMGDVYHCLGPVFSEAEDAAYHTAEELRQSLLKTTEGIAAEAMTRLRGETDKLQFSEHELVIVKCPRGGIRSAILMEEGNEIIDTIHSQNELLMDWRALLIELLAKPLSNRDQPADGAEYNSGLETQAQAEVYLQAYAALLADRREALTSDRTTLASLEDRASGLHNANVPPDSWSEEDPMEAGTPMAVDDEAPEQDVTLFELTMQRKSLRGDNSNRSLRMIAVDLNRISQRVGDAKEETQIARMECTRLRRVLIDQERVTEKFEGELVPLRRAFNERVQYFRQLQELSDSVGEIEWAGDAANVAQEALEEAVGFEADIRMKSARLRYLRNMAKEQEDAADDEDHRTCILCKCEFTQGQITQCAHVFCEECIALWLKKGSKACPVCRFPISASAMHHIVVHDSAQAVKSTSHQLDQPTDGNIQNEVAFNMIDPQLYRRIQAMKAHGSYGSKIETLMKHLLLVQEHEPGAKSIVFSAWADSLHIIEHALVTNGIPCLRVDAGKSKENAARTFRNDPNLLVFLLHGERENAGLNVTCAKRVFLVEPVVNHAFEVQAISRIDRMGQTHNTEVYCYFAEDTVEENILNLAARQGLSLYTETQAHGTLDATAIITTRTTVDSPTKRRTQKGDFVAKIDDMMQIMWPHIFAPLRAQHSLANALDSFTGNAVAGPSRL